MTPRATARLFDLAARPLLAGYYRRVEGDGFLAYRYAGNGPGSEVIRVDLLDDFPVRPKGSVEQLTGAARRLPRAYRVMAAGSELPPLEGRGWKLSRVAVNAEKTAIRLELKVGERHSERFTL